MELATEISPFETIRKVVATIFTTSAEAYRIFNVTEKCLSQAGALQAGVT
jgi:hypothetical protein